MQQEVVPFDLARMFLGDHHPLYYAEILVRTIVIYIYTLTLIRWFGGRGIAKLSLVEFLLVIALGSAVGDAMFNPQVPLLHGMVVVTVVVGLNRAIDTLIFHSHRAERLVIGRAVEVIRDGIIDTGAMRKVKLGRSELFEMLRDNGIANLGKVRRGYLEASGDFSFFLKDGPAAGLPVMPPWAIDPPPRTGPAAPVPAGARLICADCATPLPEDAAATPARCPRCGGDGWVEAEAGD